MLIAGTRLGPYEIHSVLGSGGMGEVYRARDTRLERDVAIKVLPPHLTHDADARERLRREALAAAALDHPFICKIFEIGDDDDRTSSSWSTSRARRCRSPGRGAPPASDASTSPTNSPKRSRKPTGGGLSIAI